MGGLFFGELEAETGDRSSGAPSAAEDSEWRGSKETVAVEPLCRSGIPGSSKEPIPATLHELVRTTLTEIAVEAFRSQLAIAGAGPFLFPSDKKPDRHQRSFTKVWHLALRRAGVPHFRIYDLRSTYATRLSAGGVADEWVTQLRKLDRMANESQPDFDTARTNSRILPGSATVLLVFFRFYLVAECGELGSGLGSMKRHTRARSSGG